MNKFITTISLIILLVSFSASAQKPGSPDSTFNSNGIRITQFGNSDEEASAIAIQPDGKSVIAGYTYDGFTENPAVARYNLNGTPDSSFGINGTFLISVDNKECRLYTLGIQPDGKIVAGGSIHQSTGNNDFLLIRLKANGTPDTSFGTNAIVIADFSSHNDVINGLVIQPNGKIVVAGSSSSNGLSLDFALARYNADGTPDNTFSGTGKLTTRIGAISSVAYALVRQTDGKLIAGGYSYTRNLNFTLARYNEDGTLDNTFNDSGKVATDVIGYDDRIISLALQQDGKIVAGGFTETHLDFDFALARYKNNGVRDSTFGSNGIVTTDFFSGYDEAYSIAIQPDGKIIAGGYANDGTQYLFALARYKTDGTKDPTFGNNGLITTDINTSPSSDDDDINAIALQADGKIIATGITYNGSDYDFATARYLPGVSTGVLDFASPVNSYLIYPNPVAENTRLEYELKNEETISVQLFDINGRLVNTVSNNQHQAAGKHELNIPFSSQLAAGAYFVRISSGNGQVNVKMIKN